MGTTLRRIRVSVVGKVQDAEKIPGWMRENGGTYSKAVTRNVTHLIASEEAYAANVEAGKLARMCSVLIVFDDPGTNECQRISTKGQETWNRQDRVLRLD